MSTYRFSERSAKNLAGIHPHLVAVTALALSLSEIDFVVIEGRRTRARQAELVASGASRTMNSRHITGHAVDVVPWVDGQIRWDWPYFIPLAKAFRQAARKLDIPITWGGTWASLNDQEPDIGNLHRSFPDGPHFELDRKEYP